MVWWVRFYGTEFTTDHLQHRCFSERQVYNREHLLPIHFTRSFLKQVLGLSVGYMDYQTDDPELWRTQISYMVDNNIDNANLGLRFGCP